MAMKNSAAVQIAAPQRVPIRPSKHTGMPVVVPVRPQTPASGTAHLRRSAYRTLKIFLVSVCMLAMLSLLIFERAQLIELNIRKANAEEELRIAQSETVRLEAEFNSMVSVENVEEYAVNKLGMVKRQGRQVQFFSNENKDEILLVNPLAEQ